MGVGAWGARVSKLSWDGNAPSPPAGPTGGRRAGSRERGVISTAQRKTGRELPARERAVVLIIDDEGNVCGRARDLLASRYEVICVETVARALSVMRELQPDLVVFDAATDDALSAVSALRAEGRSTPIVFVCDGGEEAIVRCFEAGATDVVQPPIQGRAIVARLERLLRDSRERRSLAEQAQTDALTGLSNYRALAVRLTEEVKRSTRYRYPLAAVMIDLDHLKMINDRFGHEVGNRAIEAVGRHLRANLRDVDFGARFGGDEFVVLLPHQSGEDALVFAERVRAGLAPLGIADERGLTVQLSLTLSIGIASLDPHAAPANAEELLRRADSALYQSKRRGRDRIVVFSEQPDESDKAEHH